MSLENHPECDKLLAVKDKSQPIGEFLDWLRNEKGIEFCRWMEAEDIEPEGYYPDYTRTEELLAEYFEVDLKKVEEERRAMLDDLRERNARTEVGK